MELNAFKHDLFKEKNCLRIIEELEYKLNKEFNKVCIFINYPFSIAKLGNVGNF